MYQDDLEGTVHASAVSTAIADAAIPEDLAYCVCSSLIQLIRLFNIGECGRVQGICMEIFLDMPTSPSLILWCIDWDWDRTVAN